MAIQAHLPKMEEWPCPVRSALKKTTVQNLIANGARGHLAILVVEKVFNPDLLLVFKLTS